MNILLIVFGVGLLQVLLTAPGGIVQQFPKDMAKLGRLIAAGPQGRWREEGDGVIEVENLTVRFAGVTPIDDVSVAFSGGTCGLIGPNGAGKTTFFNVLSGFVKPAGGSVKGFGEDLLRMADYRRARWGLRRTFQTEQAIEQLSVFDNVAMIHEHSGAKRASRRADVLAAIEFVGLASPPKVKVGGLGAHERRLVEVARAVVGQPRVVLLDEPAAGLPDEETGQLGEVIRRIPEQFGALVILVDHDMSLVSACCETTAVLDFGKLIATGPTADVLRDENVMRAYLGTEARRYERGDAEHACGSTSLDGRPRGPPRPARGLARDPGRRDHDAARPERSRQVDAGARGRRHHPPDGRRGRVGDKSLTGCGPSRSARQAWRSCPRAGGSCPS